MPKVFELSYSEMLAVKDFYQAWRREQKALCNTSYWADVHNTFKATMSEEDYAEFVALDDFGQAVELNLKG